MAVRMMLMGGVFVLALACTPTVQVAAPQEPIRIEIKIEHEIRVRIERDLEAAIAEDDEIF